jgi:hypothetical protein
MESEERVNKGRILSGGCQETDRPVKGSYPPRTLGGSPLGRGRRQGVPASKCRERSERTFKVFVGELAFEVSQEELHGLLKHAVSNRVSLACQLLADALQDRLDRALHVAGR